jgi:hypothetical protein
VYFCAGEFPCVFNLKEKQMKTVSIGIMREDGDLGLLATLNNLDEHMSDVEFDVLVYGVRAYMEAMSKQKVIVLEREDAPDYVEL